MIGLVDTTGGSLTVRLDDAMEMLDVDAVGMFMDIGVLCVNKLAASERRLFVVYRDRG